MAQNAPHPLLPYEEPQLPPAQQTGGVVMQAVPFDPLAGPVKVASRKPAAKPVADAKPADALVPPVITIDSKATRIKTADKGQDTVPALRLTADARSP